MESFRKPANFYTVQAPTINDLAPGETNGGLFWIDRHSPKAHRIAIHRYAYYFKREMSFDSVQYEPSEHTNKNCRAFGIIKRDPAGKTRLIGAGCFRFRQYSDHPSEWVLQWIYFHPCARHKGHMTQIFPTLQADIGPFSVEGPLSSDMDSFLSKHYPGVQVSGSRRNRGIC